ncbi:hypothetical protein K0M31_017849 [Melipona bicolor]|uniref:Uncharacterized protein n=1 Tax=Melipona bicolor TaxID=60889 RepID=A0AA40KST4_9HYME|nr:hypothetical protein K0M31_017849 [Melipona bicolor]
MQKVEDNLKQSTCKKPQFLRGFRAKPHAQERTKLYNRRRNQLLRQRKEATTINEIIASQRNAAPIYDSIAQKTSTVTPSRFYIITRDSRISRASQNREARAVGAAFPLFAGEETQQKRTTLDESSCTRVLEDELALAGAERMVLIFLQVETGSPQGVNVG